MENWLQAHYIEIVGVIFSVIYLFFSIRQNILLWPTGMISAILYMVVFFQARFYADMSLNAYYFFISIYGWIVWRKGKANKDGQGKILRIQRKQALILAGLTALGFVSIGLILDRYTDSPIPYWDALTTAMSFTATWMLARKILEHWILWIIVDAISMALYLYRGLYPTMILFALYTTMAVIGYLEWTKSQSLTRP